MRAAIERLDSKVWLFTKIGFFSVVSHEMPGFLVVRSRVWKDILALERELKKVKGDGKWTKRRPHYHDGRPVPMNSAQETPGRDYPYRLYIQRDRFAKWIAAHVNEMLYTNFKSEVGQHNPKRAIAYHDVWATMADLEKRAP